MTRTDKTKMGLLLCAAFREKYAYVGTNEPIPWLPRIPMAVLLQCTPEAVRLIEERALRKLRRAMTPDDWDLLNHIFQSDRHSAKPK